VLLKEEQPASARPDREAYLAKFGND